MKLTKEQVLGIVRHTLTFVGGSMTLAWAIWSVIEKK